MDEFIFSDPGVQPDELSLKQAFGKAFPYFQALERMTQDFSHEWKFYPKSGWSYKTGNKKKALFYLKPLKGGFTVSMAIREGEKEHLMSSGLPSALIEQLRKAEKFPEGFPVRLSVSNESEFKPLREILDILIPVRR